MKYKTTIQIEKPIDEVWEFFTNPDNLSKWQPGFRSMELISGEEGSAGSKTKLIYEERGKPMELMETLVKMEKPEFHAIYEAKGVWNLHKSKFSKIDENTTLYESETEFKFSGLYKLLMLMKFKFKSTTEQELENFKKAVEAK